MSARRSPVALAGLIATAILAVLVPVGLSLADAGRDAVAPRFVSTVASKRVARQDVKRRIAAVLPDCQALCCVSIRRSTLLRTAIAAPASSNIPAVNAIRPLAAKTTAARKPLQPTIQK